MMNNLSDNQVSIYEEPVQEKIRKFIKIEFLFNKLFYFKHKENKQDNYIALLALCELYEILSRSDIKSELIREIENQNHYFKKIKEIHIFSPPGKSPGFPKINSHRPQGGPPDF